MVSTKWWPACRSPSTSWSRKSVRSRSTSSWTRSDRRRNWRIEMKDLLNLFNQQRQTLDFDGIKIGLRSEEHTSELQSHVNLVCRLLLEKKKKKRKTHIDS